MPHTSILDSVQNCLGICHDTCFSETGACGCSESEYSGVHGNEKADSLTSREVLSMGRAEMMWDMNDRLVRDDTVVEETVVEEW